MWRSRRQGLAFSISTACSGVDGPASLLRSCAAPPKGTAQHTLARRECWLCTLAHSRASFATLIVAAVCTLIMSISPAQVRRSTTKPRPGCCHLSGLDDGLLHRLHHLALRLWYTTSTDLLWLMVRHRCTPWGYVLVRTALEGACCLGRPQSLRSACGASKRAASGPGAESCVVGPCSARLACAMVQEYPGFPGSGPRACRHRSGCQTDASARRDWWPCARVGRTREAWSGRGRPSAALPARGANPPATMQKTLDKPESRCMLIAGFGLEGMDGRTGTHADA